MFSWYGRSLLKRPQLTQALTTASLAAVGDILAQQVVENRDGSKHNFWRTGRMSLYGGVIFAPLAGRWYRFLELNVILRTRLRTATARVAADQLVCAPAMIGLFLSSMAITEGVNPLQRLEGTYWVALSTNWGLWPLVQAANLTLVPAQHRLLLVNLVNIGWNCFLSYINSKEMETL